MENHTKNPNADPINNYQITIPEMSTLMMNLRKEDKRNLGMMNRFQWIYFVLILFYAGVFILNPDKDLMFRERISGGCYVIGFFLFTLIFRKYYKEYKAVDYSAPLLELLKQAVKRYSIRFKMILLALIPVFFIDAGLTLSAFPRVIPDAPLKSILWIQGVFLLAITLSILAGLWIWKIRSKPIRDEALDMLKDLQNG